MNSLDFWIKIKSSIIENRKIALAIVFDADNSTPGRKGFKMFVTQEDIICGSVGGGLIEAMVIQECKNLLLNPKSNYFKEYKLLGNAKDSIGMICNGVQIIGFVIVDEKYLSIIDNIITSIESNKAGSIIITCEKFDFKPDKVKDSKFNKEHFKYVETTGIKNRVYIFGGGHVGLAVSKILAMLEFYVLIIDNRKDVSTLVSNKYANEIIIKDFVEAVSDIIEDENSYIVIVTPGHMQDKEVLKAVLDMKVKYIGMMGSESKVRTIYKELVSDGINEDALSRIHSPIGVKIRSETPEEIAISIAAEIIGIKNTK